MCVGQRGGGPVCIKKHNSDGTTDQNTPAHCKRSLGIRGGPVTAAMSFPVDDVLRTDCVSDFLPQTGALVETQESLTANLSISCIHIRQNTLLRNWRIEKIDASSLSGPEHLQRPYSALCEQLHQRQPSMKD